MVPPGNSKMIAFGLSDKGAVNRCISCSCVKFVEPQKFVRDL